MKTLGVYVLSGTRSLRVGTAQHTPDGEITVTLHALPSGGVLHLRQDPPPVPDLPPTGAELLIRVALAEVGMPLPAAADPHIRDLAQIINQACS